jgi:ATP-dependent Clp protease, protease subunit
MYPPSIIETTGRSSRAFDLPTKLLQDRIIYLCDEVNEDSANSIIMQLLWLNADDPESDIDLYINSPGGSVYDGLAIKDVIDNLKCKVNTIGLGFCASMGAFLLSAGTGKRKATKNCRIMIHSVSSGTRGTIHDMEIDYEETKYLQDKLMRYMTDYTNGKSDLETLKEKSKRDYYMSPDEAIELGLIDIKI